MHLTPSQKLHAMANRFYSREIRSRDVWVWLPLKSIDRPDAPNLTAITGKAETLRVQEWLAMDKGLI